MTSERPIRYRGVLSLTLGLVSIAIAGWLVPASVHVVDWQGDAARRVVLLAPFSSLAVWLLLSAAIVLGLVVWLPTASRQRLGRVVVPLSILLLWTIPFLPILPDHFPLMLTLAGPLRWLVAGLGVVGCLFAAVREKLLPMPTVPRGLPGPRGVFVLSVLVLLVAGAQMRRSAGLSGDEPHYLVIAHSLVADGDLRIENNHQAGDYRSFYPGFLPMHYLTTGVDGVIYSVHAPGLPTLLAPAYLLGGYRGALVLLILIAALAATAVFSLAAHLTTPGIALTTWAAVTLTVPFLLQSGLVYPEIPASAITAFSVLWLWSPVPQRLRPWLLRGAVIGFLPWLHLKFSFLLAGLTISLLVKLWSQRRLATVVLLGPMAVSGVAWLSAYYVMYGTLNPMAAYGGPMLDVGPEFIPRGVLGLFFDQEFGLLLYSPLYVLAIRGCWLMLRGERTRWPTLAMTVTLVVFVLSVTQYYMWWGGYSVPARFLVPALPLLAPMIAVALGRLRSSTGIGVTGALFAASLCSLASIIFTPTHRLMLNDADATGRLVEAWQGSVNLTAVLPSFIDLDWPTQLPWLALWLGAAVVGALVTWALEQSGALRFGAFSLGALWLVIVGALVSVAAGGGHPTLQVSMARDGQQAVLQLYGDQRLTAYAPDGFKRLTDDEFFSRATLTRSVVENPSRPEGLIAGPFALPPGRYEVTVQFRPHARPSGSVWLRYDTGPTAIAAQAAGRDGFAVFTADLPLGLDTVWVGATTIDTVDATSAVRIRPLHIQAVSERLTGVDITAVRRLEGPSRYLFFLDGVTFHEPSRWWIGGDETVSLLISPNGAQQVAVAVRRGAAGGTTTVKVQDLVHTTDMQPRRRWDVSADLTGSETFVPVSIGCSGGFRPRDVNTESVDSRYLGCEVTVRLF